VSTLALTRPGARDDGRADSAPSLFDDMGGEPTLDELLVGVWEGLATHRTVGCPVCGEDMAPVYGVHAKPIGGRCGNCGSKLA
jgi:hypothetical protein